MMSAETLLKRTKVRRRRIGDWLEDHFDVVEEELSSGGGRRRWQNLLAAVLQAGLVDERGKEPSAQTLTRTWQRVTERRKSKQKGRAAWVRLEGPGKPAPREAERKAAPGTPPRTASAPATNPKPPPPDRQARAEPSPDPAGKTPDWLAKLRKADTAAGKDRFNTNRRTER